MCRKKVSMNDGVSIAVSTPDRYCGRHGFESRTPTKTIFKDIQYLIYT